MAPLLGESRQSYAGELRCVEELNAGIMFAVEGGNRLRTGSWDIAWVVKPKAQAKRVQMVQSELG
jgi:hypothetical protein